MPRISRVLVTAILLAATIGACGRREVALPSPDRLAGHSVIRRDTFGIPHILADSEDAAAFAFGYAQAEDHAVEIARRMISARGEEARYFGERGLANDTAMAHFRNLEEATAGLERISPLYRAILEAYAAGVNRYVERHRAALPEWMPRLTAADVLANSRASAVEALAGPGLQRQLREKYEGRSTSDAAANPDWVDDAPGSNALALGGSRTVSGAPILLGNPHLSWASLYWEAHVRVPGQIDFYGSTLVGIPVLRAGFNDRLAFVTTNNAPDLDDVYALQMVEPERYIFDNKLRTVTRRDAVVRVRNDDGSMREERRTFWDTHLGPVIYRTKDRVFVVKSARLEALRYFEGFYHLSKARNLDDWQNALRYNLVPTSNFTYADADGNVLYQWNARLPVRSNPAADYRLDVPAASRDDLWELLHKVDDLPRLINPPGGYIQNANNPPQFVSSRDAIDMTRFPAYVERGPLALRPQLAIDLIESQDKFSAEDVIRLKYNTRMLLAERVKPALIAAVRQHADASADAKTGADVLDAWDNRAAPESRGTALFQRFWDAYAAKVRQPFERPWDAADPFRTPAGLADTAAAVAALEEAVRATHSMHGSAAVAWGEVNRFRVGSVDLPGDGIPGTYGAFRVMRFDAPTRDGAPVATRVAGNIEPNRPLVGFGDAWVLLVDFARPATTAYSVLAYGQTTDLSSPHSRDQIRIFAAHTLRRAWYTEAEIRANLQREYRP